MKSKIKPLAICSILFCFYAYSNAQDYYGDNTNNSWRRKPENKQNQAQNNDDGASQPSGYLSINYGFAIPEGDFASPFGSGYGGYALRGDLFHFSLGIPISHSNFGIAFMLGNYNNQYDLNTFANNNVATALYPDQNYYSETSILGGGYATYPMGRFSFDGRLMAGVILNDLPEQYYGYYDAQGDQYVNDLQTSYPTSFALDAGVGVRFLITQFGRRKLCAMINLDYLYSKVSYNTEQIEYYTPYVNPTNTTYEADVPVSGTLPIQLFSFTFGLGYQL